MKKIVFLILLSFEASAMTPVNYCKTLPAASCEVLNLELEIPSNAGAVPVYLIKYCRDREFKIKYLDGSSNYSNPLSSGISSTAMCSWLHSPNFTP